MLPIIEADASRECMMRRKSCDNVLAIQPPPECGSGLNTASLIRSRQKSSWGSTPRYAAGNTITLYRLSAFSQTISATWLLD
jgi:hypothetical protein